MNQLDLSKLSPSQDARLSAVFRYIFERSDYLLAQKAAGTKPAPAPQRAKPKTKQRKMRNVSKTN